MANEQTTPEVVSPVVTAPVTAPMTYGGHSNLVRVNEYRSSLFGSLRRIVGTGHGMRVVPANVVRIYTAGGGFDEYGCSRNVFTVYMVDGSRFITDWDGVEAINCHHD